MIEFENQVKEAELPRPVNAAVWLETEPPAPDQIIENALDVRDKLAIIGSPKMRKSFFLLQFLICLAAGRPFLNYRIPKARRVFHIQYEIQPDHFHRRVKRVCSAMAITAEDVGDRLQILNARGLHLSGGEGVKKIAQIVEAYRPEVISFDPLYKLAMGGENAIEDAKIILAAFDELMEKTGAAVFYVHHDAKGFSGDRDIRDRGAGSNVIGRDYDACITLTPHVTESDAAVIDVLLRNYRPQEPFTALWTEDDETGGYRFELREDIAPTRSTSTNRGPKDLPPFDTYLPAALSIIATNGRPMQSGLFLEALREKTGLTHSRSKAFRDWVTSGPNSPLTITTSIRGRGRNVKFICRPEDIEVKSE